MKVSNTLVKQEKKSFSAAITGDSLQNLIKKSVSSPEAAARFTGALISAVATTPALQNCKPATVVAAALRGEGMGLTLNREYHLIPFGDSCAYVIGYRGLISLCLAGNDVADMDCVEVREGEYVGRDKRTKRPVFDFSIYETDEEAEQHPVIGYMAYCELKSGYFRSEYMTIQDILKHAERYSKAFSIEKFNKLQSGELTPQEAEKLMGGSPWYGNFEVMCRKTVVRKLLNSGYIRLANSAEIKNAIDYDTQVTEDIIPDMVMPEPNVIESTGEVIEAPQETPQTAQEAFVVEPVQDVVEEEKPRKRGRKPAQKKEPEPVQETEDEYDDVMASFFDED